MTGTSTGRRAIDELYAEVFPPRRGDTFADVRRRFDDTLARTGVRDDATIEEIDAGGVPALRVTAGTPTSPGAVLWFHGGGYTIGSARGYAGFASELSAACGRPVVMVDYRLAPEHPFPAAFDDAVAATRWLVSTHGADAIVGGDSAGGGLVLAGLTALRDVGCRLPRRAVVIAPVADLTATGASFDANATTDAVLSRAAVEQMRRTYLHDVDPLDVRASPGHANLRGLPPTLVIVSASEVLLDDARMVAARLADGDVPHELVVGDDLPHVWPVFAPLIPEATASLEQIAAFLARPDGASPDETETAP